MKISNRPTAEVFNEYLVLAQKNDIQTDINRNFSADCVLLTSYGIFKNHQGVKEAAKLLEKQIGRTTYKYNTKMIEGDIAFLEWSAEGKNVHIDDGADTFLIRNGLIEIMTIHYTLTFYNR
ncbi:MAG TPA: hypothetical protein VJ964_04450 [Balneolaceae bacterium]|nr:hypothetical protein [Balneolaceae bacterium]